MKQQIPHHEATEKLHGPELGEVVIEDCRNLGISKLNLPAEILDIPYSEIIDSIDRIIEYGDEDDVIDSLTYLSMIGDIIVRTTERTYDENDNSSKLLRTGAKYELYDLFCDSAGVEIENDLSSGKFTFTVRDIANFVDFYYRQYDKKNTSQKILEVVTKSRDEFLKDINSDRAKALINDDETRNNIKETAGQTPIIVVDSLTAQLAHKGMHFEFSGFFTSYASREIYIKYDLDSNPDNSSHIDNINKTVYHELLHAAFNKSYTRGLLNQDENDPFIPTSYVKQKFPLFLEEAIVEKIAYSLSGERGSKKLLNIVLQHKNESHYRQAVDAPETILSLADPEMGKSSYYEYRLLLDYVFDKINWTKAGIDKNEAEHLLIQAVFERADENAEHPSHRHPHRKVFFDAIKKAGAAGIINRIGSAVESFGVSRVIDFIRNDNFDIQNFDDLPMMRSKWTLEQQEKNVKISESRLESLEKLGSPDLITDPLRRIIETDKRQLYVTRRLAKNYDKFDERLRNIAKTDYQSKSYIFEDLIDDIYK